MLDSLDIKLLDSLQSNATLSTGVLAEKLGYSKSAIWRRVTRLEEQGIIKTRAAILDAAQLGLGLTVYISIKTNQHNEVWSAKFTEITQALSQVLEVHRMSGDLDYLIKAVVKDMKGFDQLYQELIKADLYDVSSSFVMEELKSTTRLPLNYVNSP